MLKIKFIICALIFMTSSLMACKCGCDCDDDCNCGCAETGKCWCSFLGAAGYDYESYYPTPLRNRDAVLAAENGLIGVWLPEDPSLWHYCVADPRAVQFSVGWRLNDKVINHNVIDVSYGNWIGIYRWFNVWPWGGDLEFDVEGALWACFEPLLDSAPLVNADYYVAFPLTYSIDRWAFRLRGFHISSHIGDEFLLDHPHFRRRNPSAEYLDFFVAHDLTDEIRLYAGLGYIIADDTSFTEKRFYQGLGAEAFLHSYGFCDYAQQIYGQPFFGMWLRGNGRFKRHLDMTYVLGYEFGKLSGLQRKLRFYIEYHDGYSVEGQFARCPTSYFSVRCAYAW